MGILGSLAGLTYILRFFMPDYRKMYKDLSHQEGKFKKIHARVKTCSEVGHLAHNTPRPVLPLSAVLHTLVVVVCTVNWLLRRRRS